MKHWIGFLFLAAGLAAASANTAAAEDHGKPMDCADLAIKLNAPDFKLSCKDFSDPSALSNAGKIQAELLTAISEKQEQFFAVWDIRAIGGIYLKRQGLEEDVHGFFPDEKLTQWKKTDDVAGYEFAQYVNQRSGSSEEECIAFRRQMNRRNGGIGDSGFGRVVLGFGCTVGDRAALIESLKQIDAPGG